MKEHHVVQKDINNKNAFLWEILLKKKTTSRTRKSEQNNNYQTLIKKYEMK